MIESGCSNKTLFTKKHMANWIWLMDCSLQASSRNSQMEKLAGSDKEQNIEKRCEEVQSASIYVRGVSNDKIKKKTRKREIYLKGKKVKFLITNEKMNAFSS